jgi:hypothetical protein
MACYDGNYPVTYDATLDKHIIESRKRRVASLAEVVAQEKSQISLL